MREIRYTGFTPAGPTTADIGKDTGEPDAFIDPNDPLRWDESVTAENTSKQLT